MKGFARALASRGSVFSRFSSLYSSWMIRQPTFAFILGGVLILALTPIGDGYGVPDLFWHESSITQMAAGSSIVSLALFVWFLSFLSRSLTGSSSAHGHTAPGGASRSTAPATQLRQALRAMFLPLGLLLLVAATIRAMLSPLANGSWIAIGSIIYTYLELGALYWLARCWHQGVAFKTWHAVIISILAIPFFATVWVCWLIGHDFWLPFGAVLTWFFIDVLLRLLSWLHWPIRWRLTDGLKVGVPLVVAVHLLGLARPTAWLVTAVMALCIVLAELALLAFVTQRRPLLRIALAIGFVLWVGWSNGSDPYKLTYPGLEAYYKRSHGGPPAASAQAPPKAAEV